MTRSELISYLVSMDNGTSVRAAGISAGVALTFSSLVSYKTTYLASLSDQALLAFTSDTLSRVIKNAEEVYFNLYGVHLMPAIAAITINDGAATPVAHVFNPVQSSPDALYRENISGLALVGQGTVKIAINPDKGNGLNKVRVVLDLPALEIASGVNSLGYTAAPKVAYSDKINIDFILPSRGTNTQRHDLLTLAKNLLSNAQVIDAVENLNVPY